MDAVVKTINGEGGAVATITKRETETGVAFSVVTVYKHWTEVKQAHSLEYAEDVARYSVATLESLDKPVEKADKKKK